MRTCLYILAIAFTTSGCLTFSSLQSAPIVPKGEYRTTISASRVEVKPSRSSWNRRDFEYRWTNIEFQGRQGTNNKRIDTGFNASFTMDETGRADLGVAAMSLGLDGRFGVIPDRLTVQLPASVFVGEEIARMVQIRPTVIATVPVAGKWEVNASSSYFFETSDGIAAFSATLGLGIPLGRNGLVLRPEIAWLRPSGTDTRTQRQFALGLEIRSRRDSTRKVVKPVEPWW